MENDSNNYAEINGAKCVGIIQGIWIGFLVTAIVNGKVFSDISGWDPLACASLTWIILCCISVHFYKKGS